jgi:hypothetical protein
MSSMPGASAPPVLAEGMSAPVVQWIVPAGARGFLAASVIVVALGLAFASYSIPAASGEAVVAAPHLLIDLNTAPAPVLEVLPHVGPTLVRQLVAARELRPFASLADTTSRVRGLGPGTAAQLRPYLRFDDTAHFRIETRAGSEPDRTDGKSRTTVRKRNRSRKPAATTLPSQLVAQRSE